MKHLIIVLLLFISTQSQILWHEHTFADFSDGSFDDAGANMYVSAKGRVQMINRWDVNGDNNIDILCVNSHPLVEMLDLSVYWGNGKDYSIRNHSYIPANGPMWVTPGDLNKDGRLDLVVANYSNGTWTEMESFIYYNGVEKTDKGNTKDDWNFYPFNERILLPSSNAQKAAIADLNRDGYQDIVFAFSGGFWEYRDKSKEGFSPSRIYWNSQNGFNKEQYDNIWTKGATDVAISDLNDDDWLDIVFSNGEGASSFVYYGSKQGYSEENLVKLPTTAAHAVKTADVNNDGASDIIFAIEKGPNSVAYLNKGGNFDKENKLSFETFSAKDVVIHDFNKDGHADVFFTNHQHSLSGDPNLANRMIDSYIYFGSKNGFSNNNRQNIQTIGAWGANAADLNKDGWTDLLICNFREHYSYEVPSFIYWNGPDGFSLLNRTPLYEHGAQGNAISDLNGDGYLDIAITSMMGNSRGDYDPNFLYLGDEKGHYSIDNRMELPGREAYEQAFADLDDDGQVDILLLNRGEVTRLANELWIYWNEDNQYDPWRITGLPSYAGLGVEVADMDRNGYLDIIISNGKELKKDEKGNPLPGSFIYWGSAEGWPNSDRTELPVVLTRASAVCDINNDGHLDLVFGQQGKWGDASIFLGNGTRDFAATKRLRIEGSNGSGTPGVADLNKDGLLDIAFAHDKNVLVYYQQKDGSFPEKKAQKVDVQAKTMCVADVNQDDWLDLICPYYKGEGRRSAYSTILLGGSNGYHLDRSIQLPTDGGTGSIVSDFNRDGFTDVFFFCHRADGSFNEVGKFGDHHANSFLYWGSANGFSEKNRLEIPSIGVHYDVGIDIGHIKNRKFEYSYESSSHYIKKKPKLLNWKAEMPPGTTLKFQLKSAKSKEKLSTAEWLGPDGPSSYYTKSNSDINKVKKNSWIQYRAIFISDNGANAPVLESVEIR
jgi:hypothetical protein